MISRKKYYLFFLVFTITCLQCSPSSGPSPKNETPRASLLSPKNGAQDIPINPELIWEKVETATEYELQVSDQNNFSNLVVNQQISDTQFNLIDLPNETTIFWRVRVIVDDKRGEWSQIFDFKTAGVPSASITLISPANDSVNQPTDIYLEWEEHEEVTDYRVQVSISNSFSNTFFDETINQTNVQLNELDEGGIYYWRVQNLESKTWSEIWRFITKPTPPSPNDFVQVSNGNFVFDGEIFRFAGTNAYYLPNYEKLDSRFVDNTLDTFKDTEISIVRMWAFYDGYDCGYSQQDSNENVIQTRPGEYSESALQDLDRVIDKGKTRGIRFILAFINYWDDLGGICQYNTWDGAANPSTNMQHFLNSANTQKWYKNYIKMLLNRVNKETGIAYKNEPAIFAWEIMNEGRYSGRNPSLLRDWYTDIAAYIKSIDSNHLVSTGEEGFDEDTPSQYSVDQYSNTYVLRAEEGTSYMVNTAIPEIDYGGAHWYPVDWGFGSNVSEDMIKAQHAWLNDHQRIAKNLGKPFVLGEYGYPGWGNQSIFTIYNELWNNAEENNLDGSLLWQLTTNYVKCPEFGGNICWPDGRQDYDLYNRFRDHIQSMENNK